MEPASRGREWEERRRRGCKKGKKVREDQLVGEPDPRGESVDGMEGEGWIEGGELELEGKEGGRASLLPLVQRTLQATLL